MGKVICGVICGATGGFIAGAIVTTLGASFVFRKSLNGDPAYQEVMRKLNAIGARFDE